ncbi:LysM peptidoglycan-binding domain-containing protein [Vibrio atypicus]|uniref:LysM peptidoglycan-binding domain-containing protein n=1 Tax=Vibrio atypicus TaxID=558271 RepID=UPI003734F4C3
MPFRTVYFIGLLLSMMVSFSAWTKEQPLRIKKDAPTTYTVVKGDTLWDISALYLDSPWLWPRLWQVNPSIENPHLIYPGDKLTLFWRNGQPVLGLKPVIKLSPKVRKTIRQPLAALPDGLVLPYLEDDRLLTIEELQSSARVLGASDGKQYLAGQNLIYINGEQNLPQWVIYRPLEEFEHGTHKMVALKKIAVAKLEVAGAKYSGLKVLSQQHEILADDIALPADREQLAALTPTFFPTPSPSQSVATILGALEGSQYVAQDQVVVLNVGSSDQIGQGMMFELYKPGALVKLNGGEEAQLPDIPIGHVMVIRPYSHFSLAVVTQSRQPISLDSTLKSPLDRPSDDG